MFAQVAGLDVKRHPDGTFYHQLCYLRIIQRALGHRPADAFGAWGGFQGILIDPRTGVLMGGSDPRKDGLAIREDESVTRFNYRLLGAVRLTRIQDQKILYETSLRATSS